MDTPSERPVGEATRPTRRRVLRLAAVGGFTVAAGEDVLGPVPSATAVPAPTVLVAAWRPPPAYDGVVGVL